MNAVPLPDDPTPQEQLMLELVNRARANPLAEAGRLGVDLNADLPPGTISPDPKPPLAFHPLLTQAARGHADWMLAADVFSHTGITNSTPLERIKTAGYPLAGSWGIGENIAWQGTTATADLTQFTIKEHEGLFRSAPHRENLLDPDFDEIGIGVRTGLFNYSGRTYDSVMIAQNFGRTAATPGPLLLGVVFRDADGDHTYSVGEGLGGYSIRLIDGGDSVLTSTAGGFALPVTAYAGTVQVALSGPDLDTPLIKTAVVTSQNVKVDFDLAADQPLTLALDGSFDAQNRLRLTLKGPANRSVRVQSAASPASEAAAWTDLGTCTLTGGQAQMLDASGKQSQRYYRALLVP